MASPPTQGNRASASPTFEPDAIDVAKAGNDLLKRNVVAASLASIEERLERINRAYRDVASGDTYTLTYAPGVGTTLRLNGKALVRIPGADFAAAYFTIWLGEDPISGKLRDKLLGR